MKILFVHENHPAQFGGFATFLVAEGHDVVFATAVPKDKIDKNTAYRTLHYSRRREPINGTHPYLQVTEKAVLNGQGFAKSALRLKGTGFVPDIVVAHSGWGSGTFAKSIWPSCKFIQYLEWWYSFPPRDKLPDSSYIHLENAASEAFYRNVPFIMDALQADKIIIPTRFQAADVPKEFRSKIFVSHDGVDCGYFTNNASVDRSEQPYKIPDNHKLLTYATRGMEPHRGFMEFMEALAIVQKKQNDIFTVIAGSDTVHYSSAPTGKSYKQKALETLKLDQNTIHFTGSLPKKNYRDLLVLSDCHVYLSVPFIPSWSLLDAAACSAPLVCSNNAAIKEVLHNERKARFVDHTKPEILADAILNTLNDPRAAQAQGARAAQHMMRRYNNIKMYQRRLEMFKKIQTS